ncbi:MAG: cytochrome c oxidase subunit II [Acetobacteraceae bacterium]|nr:cytochrome c oxidase subunit II [Acetobacteraceae bacterium]
MQLLRRMVAAVSSAPVGLAFAAAATALLAWHKAALADMPHNWQMGIQAPASPVASQIVGLHNMVLAIITVITVLVAALLAYVTWRYSAERNPTPSQTSHNTLLEVAWTVVPVLILVVIAIPSFRLVYYQDRTHDADMTIKVTGHQWYWEYTYPDSEGLNFGSRALEAKSVKPSEMKPGSMRLLDVDEPVVLPVGKNVRILTTSADVIHSFFVPSLGVQRYAIPGRTIETWVRIDKPGTYYGQCNQICGEDHSNMPITVRAIPAAEFTAWLAEAKKKYAADESIPSPAQDGRTAVLAAVRQ